MTECIFLTCLLSIQTLFAQQNYLGVVFNADSSKENWFEASVVNFTDKHTIYIGNLFDTIERADGCYQTETTYFWTFYGTDIFTNTSMTAVYTVDLAGDRYMVATYPNQTVNYYCLQLMDFPAGAVTISYNPNKNYLMEIFWVFESPIEQRAHVYRIPVSDEFVARNYSIITGIFQNFGNLIIFYRNIGANYTYAIYDDSLQTISTYGDAQCAFGNGVIDTFYVSLQLYSYFITKDNKTWLIGKLFYDETSLDVTSCINLEVVSVIPISDKYFSGDVNSNGTEIVVLTTSGVYYIDLIQKTSNKVVIPNNFDTSMLGSVNFAIDIY